MRDDVEHAYLAVKRLHSKFPDLTAREARARLTAKYDVEPSIASIALRRGRLNGITWAQTETDWVEETYALRRKLDGE